MNCFTGQGNAASIGLTGPTKFGLRGGPCHAPFPIRHKVTYYKASKHKPPINCNSLRY